MSEVWRRQSPGHPEQAILLALADLANDEGRQLFPSQAYLAWKTEYSERQVRRILGDLTEAGVVVVVRKGNRRRASEYRLELDRLPVKTAFERTPDILSGDEHEQVSDQHVLGAEEGTPDILSGERATTGHPWSKPARLPDTAMAVDPLVVLPTKPSSRPDKPAGAERAEAFEALALATGRDPTALTRSAAREIAVKLAEIRAAELNRRGRPLADLALPSEIYLRARRYRVLHPEWALTPSALAKHWPELGDRVVAPAEALEHSTAPEESDRVIVQPPWVLEGLTWREYAARVAGDRAAAAELAAHARIAVEDAPAPAPAEVSG